MSITHEPMDTDSVYRRKKKAEKTPFEKLPLDIQEEIECLYEFVPEIESHFEILDKIGEGTFSSVFLAKLKHCPQVKQLFALKHIIPTSHPSRIEGELRCLLEIGGIDNVMGVELCVRNKDHVVIVMQYFPHEKFQDYILDMSVQEVRDYMKNLMLALRRVHTFDIIHRDVKPSNFLYDRKTKRYTLVDFGLAHKIVGSKRTSHEPQQPSTSKGILTPVNVNTGNQMNTKMNADSGPMKQYTPSPPTSLTNSVFTKHNKSPRRLLLAKRALHMKGKEDRLTTTDKHQPIACQCYGKPRICQICTARSNQIAPRAGTPGFRSPEVLMKCPDQTTAVDIWSAGVIFLSLLSGRYPFFRATDDMTALGQIICMFGTDTVKNAAEACDGAETPDRKGEEHMDQFDMNGDDLAFGSQNEDTGKNLVCSQSQMAVNIREACMKLRAAPASKASTRKSVSENEEAILSWRNVPDSAFDLLKRLLDLNPYTRISAEEALKHPFLTETF